MQRKEIIVIGTSSGGIDAMKALVSELPPDLKASIFVTLHVAPTLLASYPRYLSAQALCPPRTPKTGSV
ncbi:MAG TPA: chemotaxis protein CheB [Pyrinomonadaceae bacterium]|nr:chemotaxis protein CheB [Pyrinomonadaceae bacterium]